GITANHALLLRQATHLLESIPMIASIPPVAGRVFRISMGGLRGMVKAPIRSSMAWVVLGAALVPGLYLPGLMANFDFVADGNLVYPAPAMPPGQRLALIGEKILANQLHLGPIRPTLWAHWRIQADLLGGNAVAWRLLRLAWAMLAAGAFLWLL